MSPPRTFEECADEIRRHFAYDSPDWERVRDVEAMPLARDVLEFALQFRQERDELACKSESETFNDGFNGDF